MRRNATEKLTYILHSKIDQRITIVFARGDNQKFMMKLYPGDGVF